MAVILTKCSLWQKVLLSKNDQVLITVTGFDLASLQFLFSLPAPLFDKCPPFVAGCISPIDPEKGRKKRFGTRVVLVWCWSGLAPEVCF